MSKFDPSISQEERVKMRGWEDGDISMVNGRTACFNAATMTWETIDYDPDWYNRRTWYGKRKWKGAKSFRADGTPYIRRSIPSEDLPSF